MDTGNDCYAGDPNRVCPAGYTKFAALCYENCPDGYEAITAGDLFCYQATCPPDFRDDGLYCGKPTDSYGRGTGNYIIWLARTDS
jgi:hypothetical protein